MATWLCEKCSREFTNQEEYKQHKIDHQLGKVDGGIDPVTGEPRMNDEQVTVTKAEEVKVEEKKPEDKPKPPWAKTGDPKPIKLVYHFQGDCDKCGRQVDTLEMDVGSEFFAVAYCTGCHEKKTQRKVAKL